MGVHENIGADVYPEQSRFKGNRAVVCFQYDTSRRFPATIVRDDMDEPYRTILQLDDGRFVLGVECQWQPAAWGAKP